MILYGLPVAQKIETDIKSDIERLKKDNIKPFLAVILVGDDPASLLYVKKKEEKAESLGLGFKLYHFPEMAAESAILDKIDALNQDNKVHGILVQLPLPKNIETEKILESIAPEKNIELVSPAALAILEILKFYKIDLKKQKIVLVGHGKLVGEPLHQLLMAQRVKPSVCDAKTKDLKAATLSADMVISAVGKPGLIKPDMVSENAIVIDAGTAESGGKTMGDVDKKVYEKVTSYSPVPGGVGPVTVAMLFKNLIEAVKRSND